MEVPCTRGSARGPLTSRSASTRSLFRRPGSDTGTQNKHKQRRNNKYSARLYKNKKGKSVLFTPKAKRQRTVKEKSCRKVRQDGKREKHIHKLHEVFIDDRYPHHPKGYIAGSRVGTCGRASVLQSYIYLFGLRAWRPTTQQYPYGGLSGGDGSGGCGKRMPERAFFCWLECLNGISCQYDDAEIPPSGRDR